LQFSINASKFERSFFECDFYRWAQHFFQKERFEFSDEYEKKETSYSGTYNIAKKIALY